MTKESFRKKLSKLHLRELEDKPPTRVRRTLRRLLLFKELLEVRVVRARTPNLNQLNLKTRAQVCS